MLDRRI
jgi:hypothetical protein